MIVLKVARAAIAVGVIAAGSAAMSAQQAAVAPTPTPQRSGPPLAATRTPEAPLPTQGFSVVLVLGDLQGGSTPDNVPPAARKALADMKDFLPYKSYRLLDAEWILGSNSVATRLRGIDDQEYSLNMYARAASDGSKGLSVTFQLREAGAGLESVTIRPYRGTAAEAQTSDLAASRARLERQLEMLRQKDGENHPDVAKTRAELSAVEKQIVEIERQRSDNTIHEGAGLGSGRGQGVGLAARAGGSIISTNFTMDPGETVVVGTSRLRGGDKALIALLTAVPHGKTAGKE